MRPSSNDLPRTVLAILFLFLLIAGSFQVVKPFLGALLWAAMIVIATWPLRVNLERWFGGRRKLAVTTLVVALLLLFFLPLFAAIGALVNNADKITEATKGYFANGLPPAPAWIAGLPLVGGRIAAAWARFAGSQLGELASQMSPYVGNLASWLAGKIGGLGRLLAQFLLTVALSGVLWSSGKDWAAGILRFARRLGGEEAAKAAILASQAIRSVALGVVVTAIVQTVLAGIGLAVAGIPFASVLTVLIFVLCIAQIGPLLVMLPAVFWVFSQDRTGWGIFLLVWTLVVGTMDNFMRPILIRRGADLPLMLVFAGVIGGLLSFGLVGLFIGPVLLAVANTLLGAWIATGPEGAEAAPADS